MKESLNLILIFFMMTIFPSCGNNSSSSDSSESYFVEVGDYDRPIQSYIPDPQKALLSPSSLTTDDLRPSGHLLLSPGGNLKALETSTGYHKVVSYRCTSVGRGWYHIYCEYKTEDQICDWECYIRERI